MLNLLDPETRRRIPRQVAESHVGAADDADKKIIEIMRHAAGEHRDAFDLLSILNTGFERYPFTLRALLCRDVDGKSAQLHSALFPDNDAADISKPQHPSVRGRNPKLDVVGRFRLRRPLSFPHQPFDVVGVNDITPELLFQPFLLRIAKPLRDLGSNVEQAVVHQIILPRNDVGGFH